MRERRIEKDRIEKHRKKELLLLVCCILAIGWLVVPVRAAEQRVYDGAALFTQEQVEQLETQIDALETRIASDVIVLTTENAEGKTAMAYADDFYDNHGFGTGTGKSGVLFLIDMDNRELWISTSGTMIDILTDERIDRILGNVYDSVLEQDYVQATEKFLNQTEKFVEQGVEKGQYRYDVEQEKQAEQMTLPQALGVGAVVGIGISGIFCLVIVLRYRGKRNKETYAYQEYADMHLTRKEDMLLNSVVTHRKIPKNPPPSSNSSSHHSAGRSSVHHSSSGASHGGGGKKF